MSQFRRFAVGVFFTLALAVTGVIYQQVYMNELHGLIGEHPGPFSFVQDLLANIPVVVIVGLLLAVWTWVLVGGAQEERAQEQQVIRR